MRSFLDVSISSKTYICHLVLIVRSFTCCLIKFICVSSHTVLNLNFTQCPYFFGSRVVFVAHSFTLKSYHNENIF